MPPTSDATGSTKRLRQCGTTRMETASFLFFISQKSCSGIRIIAANMDHTGTHEIARALAKSHLITALHKFYSIIKVEQK